MIFIKDKSGLLGDDGKTDCMKKQGENNFIHR
jgi:hypothetical protein